MQDQTGIPYKRRGPIERVLVKRVRHRTLKYLQDTSKKNVFEGSLLNSISMHLRSNIKIVLIAVCWMIPSSTFQTKDITSISFHKPPTCPAQVPRDYMQVSEVGNRPNILSCTVTCASSPVCNSVVFNRVDKTCHLSQQVAAPNCTNMENSQSGNVYLQKKHMCKNGGIPLGDTCECVSGYIGQTCELGPMRDCSDYFKAEQVQGNYIPVIRPTDSDAFPVNCYSDRVTVMNRKDKKLNFTRPWLDYREGFGNLNDSHWLGLEKMYILTSQNRNYLWRIQVTLKNGTSLYTIYNNITIKNEKSFYQLNFDNIRTKLADDNIGDCLSDLRGANFSTYDNDNDGDNTVKCTGRHQGGWWFCGKTCSTCNPTGQLLQPASGLRTGVDSEVFWIKDFGDVVPYKINIRFENMP